MHQSDLVIVAILFLSQVQIDLFAATCDCKLTLIGSRANSFTSSKPHFVSDSHGVIQSCPLRAFLETLYTDELFILLEKLALEHLGGSKSLPEIPFSKVLSQEITSLYLLICETAIKTVKSDSKSKHSHY